MQKEGKERLIPGCRRRLETDTEVPARVLLSLLLSQQKPSSCQQEAQTECAELERKSLQLRGQELPEGGSKYLMGPSSSP